MSPFAGPPVRGQVHFVTPQIRPVVPSDFLILTVVIFIILWALSPGTLILMVPALVCSLMVSRARVPEALVALVKLTCCLLTSLQSRTYARNGDLRTAKKFGIYAIVLNVFALLMAFMIVVVITTPIIIVFIG